MPNNACIDATGDLHFADSVMRRGGVDAQPGCSRRKLLGRFGIGAGLASVQSFWDRVLKAEDAAVVGKAAGARAKSVIMIFNCGAPSHTDLWDMKPLASSEVRGEFSPIETNVPGIQISELLPNLATRMDKLAVVRTLHHSHGGHNSGMYWSIVGKPYRVDSTLINPGRADVPSLGTLVGWLSQQTGFNAPVPPYVITPFPHCDSFQYLTPGQFGGCLGSRFDPFVLNSDPNSSSFQVPGLQPIESVSRDRMADRGSLLTSLERGGARIETDLAKDILVQREKALGLLESRVAGHAFDLTRESEETRNRYGRHSWGQSHLLARRLIESGTRFVTTVNGPSITWDTHKDNFKQLKNRLVPPMEQAFVALLDDLTDRGLLDETLVIWMGDFGRTPMINKDVGRDHWPQCYSMVLAGGGLKTGQVIGESDKTGAQPRLRPVTPADIHATVFRALGYNPSQITYHLTDGRPAVVSDGTPLSEL